MAGLAPLSRPILGHDISTFKFAEPTKFRSLNHSATVYKLFKSCSFQACTQPFLYVRAYFGQNMRLKRFCNLDLSSSRKQLSVKRRHWHLRHFFKFSLNIFETFTLINWQYTVQVRTSRTFTYMFVHVHVCVNQYHDFIIKHHETITCPEAVCKKYQAFHTNINWISLQF